MKRSHPNIVASVNEPSRTVMRAEERPWYKQRWLMILAGYSFSFLTGMAFAAWVIRSGDWHQGMQWERDLTYRLHLPLPEVVDAFMMVLPWFGTNLTLIPVVLLVVIWLWRWKHRPHLAMRLLIVQIGSYILNPALKYLYDRPRPELIARRGWYGWASYPSGHAIASVAVLMTVALLLHEEKGWKWPFFVTVPAVLASLYSRIYLGVHWPTDVIGGALVGLVWLVMSTLAFREGNRRPARVVPDERAISPESAAAGSRRRSRR